MSNKHHIALMVTEFAGGGAEARIADLANHYAAQGHRVDFITLRQRDDYYDFHEGVKQMCFHKHYSILALWPLVKYLQRETPDLFSSVLIAPNVLAVCARWLAGVRADARSGDGDGDGGNGGSGDGNGGGNGKW